MRDSRFIKYPKILIHVSYLRTLRAKILLLALSLFYEVAFIERIWTDPNLTRAYIGLAGLLVAGASGLIYSTEHLLGMPVPIFPYSTAVFVGLLLFLIGGFGKRMKLTFDEKLSRENVMSRGTVLCLVSDTKQSSSIIELLVSSASEWDEDRLRKAEPFLVFAHEIWRESLMKKGVHLIGQLSSPKDLISKMKITMRPSLNKNER